MKVYFVGFFYEYLYLLFKLFTHVKKCLLFKHE